jgi:hypothetical protein
MSTRAQLISTVAITAAFLLASAATPESAAAWWTPPRQVPEIDPSTVSNAIAIALGGLAVLGDKWRRH